MMMRGGKTTQKALQTCILAID
jgi:glycerol kinase